MNVVRSYVRISHNEVIRDGVAIFRHSQDEASLPDALYQFMAIDYPKFFRMDLLSKVGFLAAELLGSLLEDPVNTALVLSNSTASLDTDVRYQASTTDQASPSLFVYTLPNIVGGEISIRNGIKGETIFFVNPAFDAQWLTSYVDMLLSGNAKECLVGWLEVANGHIDVLLYLVGSSQPGFLPHSSPKISELYSYGTVDV